MSDVNTQLQTIDALGALPAVFQNSPVDVTKFTGGIAQSFPILTIKGKSWSIRYRGVTTTITAPNPAAGNVLMPVQFLDVVIVDAAASISKVFYLHGYKEGERAPPDCWSANGVVPDPASSSKQSNTCRGCQHNVFGSKVGDAGQKGKACPDNKRLAIVPAHDLRNEAWGGPMMLRLPPASFSNYSQFVAMLAAKQYPPFAVVCRLMFDPNEAFPRIVFTPIRVVTPEEAATILEIQKNPQLEQMLSDPAIGAFADAEAEAGTGAAPGGLAPPPVQTPVHTPAPPPVTQPSNPPAAVTPPPTAGWGAPPPQQAQPNPVSPPVQASPPAAVWGAPPPTAAPATTGVVVAQGPAGGGMDPGPIPGFLQRAPAASPVVPDPGTPPTAPVKTAEQLKIEELERQLAEAKTPKTRKPRSQPVSPASTAPVTPEGNGAPPPQEQPETAAQASIGNDIADRIAGLIKA